MKKLFNPTMGVPMSIAAVTLAMFAPAAFAQGMGDGANSDYQSGSSVQNGQTSAARADAAGAAGVPNWYHTQAIDVPDSVQRFTGSNVATRYVRPSAVPGPTPTAPPPFNPPADTAVAAPVWVAPAAATTDTFGDTPDAAAADQADQL
jgi:hypothetical protein